MRIQYLKIDQSQAEYWSIDIEQQILAISNTCLTFQAEKLNNLSNKQSLEIRILSETKLKPRKSRNITLIKID